MSDNPPYDPESTMAGFAARQTPPVTATNVSPPSSSVENARRTRPRRTTSVPLAPPPFGSRRGTRVTYTLQLPRPLAERIETYLHSSNDSRLSLGALAVAAIRIHWRQLRVHAGEEPEGLFTKTDTEPPQRGAPTTVRKVFYVSAAEAEAIELVRLQLNIDLLQLHERAISLYLDQELSDFE